jgi:tetratricopeptide (TPR) repeat protein
LTDEIDTDAADEAEPQDGDALPAVSAETPPHADENLVPAWLALLVLVLIVAVVGVGGFIVRGLMTTREATSPTKADIAEWSAAVSGAPDDVTARLNLAYAYQKDGQFEAALAEYDRVLKQSPKETAALYNKGVIYMAQGQAKKGETALWDALEIDPTNVLAAKELGTYYTTLGHYKSVIVALKPAVDAKPTLADLQALLALAYEKTGQKDLAVDHYRMALQFAPDMQEALDGLARLGESAK